MGRQINGEFGLSHKIWNPPLALWAMNLLTISIHNKNPMFATSLCHPKSMSRGTTSFKVSCHNVPCLCDVSGESEVRLRSTDPHNFLCCQTRQLWQGTLVQLEMTFWQKQDPNITALFEERRKIIKVVTLFFCSIKIRHFNICSFSWRLSSVSHFLAQWPNEAEINLIRKEVGVEDFSANRINLISHKKASPRENLLQFYQSEKECSWNNVLALSLSLTLSHSRPLSHALVSFCPFLFFLYNSGRPLTSHNNAGAPCVMASSGTTEILRVCLEGRTELGICGMHHLFTVPLCVVGCFPETGTVWQP